MAGSSRSGLPRGLKDVRARIEEWRRTRRRRCAMPAVLWDEAVALGRRGQTYRVSRVLGVNYESLRRRIAETSEPVIGDAAKDGFVELSGAQLLAGAAGPVVELADASGGRLTVRLATGTPVDVTGLVEAFGRRRL